MEEKTQKSIERYISQHEMVRSGDLVIAAVSGGADSVCLLLVLHELSEQMGFKLEAVHVEHGIRGEASISDMQFVQDLCGKYGICLNVFAVDVPGHVEAYGGGLEEIARKLRYEAFDNLACNRIHEGYEPERIKIALAHHVQDQAETVLFRLARGTGTNGLAGIAPVRKSDKGYWYIRPLLKTQRGEIEAYLLKKGQDYRTDATNLEENYARNRIRAKVLPALSCVNSQAAVHIAQTAELAAEQQDYIAAVARQELSRIAKSEMCGDEENCLTKDEDKWDKTRINIPKLKALHPAIQRELMRQALCNVAGHQKDLTKDHVQQLLDLTGKVSGKMISMPYGVVAVREFDVLVLQKCRAERAVSHAAEATMQKLQLRGRGAEENVPGHSAKILQNGGKTICSGLDGTNRRKDVRCGSVNDASWRKDVMCSEPEEFVISREQLTALKNKQEPINIRLSETEELYINILPTSNFIKKTYTKSFDYDMIKDGFTIRRRKPGDFFYMKDGHRKKLKQYLIEEKVPASERDKLWILARESEVLWVAGIRFPDWNRGSGKGDSVMTVELQLMT